MDLVIQIENSSPENDLLSLLRVQRHVSGLTPPMEKKSIHKGNTGPYGHTLKKKMFFSKISNKTKEKRKKVKDLIYGTFDQFQQLTFPGQICLDTLQTSAIILISIFVRT